MMNLFDEIIYLEAKGMMKQGKQRKE